MFLKLKEFGGISFHPEESVPLSIVRVGPYLVYFGLYTAKHPTVAALRHKHIHITTFLQIATLAL
jgi:hypothetical protein